MIFFLIIGVILGAVSVIFAMQNVEAVTVSFFAWSLTGSLSVVLLAAMLLGVLVCTLFTIPEIVTTHFRFRRLSKENKRLADELANQQQLLDQANGKLNLLSKDTNVVKERTVTTETTTQQVL